MKNVKAPKAVPVQEVIKVKEIKPMKIKAVVSRTKQKTWKLSYIAGKQTFDVKQEFAKLETVLQLLNCTGELQVLDEKKNKIQLA